MNDLRFAFRQLLKNPGFTAVAVLIPESGGRTPGDRQSTPKANRLPAAVPRRDTSESHARTKLSDRFADVPDANSGGLVLRKTCGKSDARPVESRAAVARKIARRPVCREKSHVPFELRIRRLRASGRIPLILRLSLIQQRAQSRTWTRITNQTLPGRIPIQFRKQRGQLGHEGFTFGRRQFSDGSGDLLHCAHGLETKRWTMGVQVAIPRTRPLVKARWPMGEILNR